MENTENIEREKIYVYCNPTMIDFIKPIEVSKIILGEYDNTCIALYESEEILDTKTEKEYEEAGAWNRGCFGGAPIDIEDYKPRIMRKEGLHKFICDVYGASSPRNVAACISQFALWEGKNPIEFYNSLNNK